ncbi:hypothetical protein ACEUC3_04395 [Aeromonas bivalvium]|uniref:Ribbon-helix-helix protein RHH domain-containing protein n=1 Tax=Aeromonas bivalvium TaxID=440079 RepID=A0ABW9GM91_9GAMM|nr:hypothetical protein [Aeromonas bivalvium]
MEQVPRKRASKPKKDAQLIIRLSSEERDQFIDLCEQQDSTASREIRRFIRQYLRSQQDDK